jgi:hypothetical protein
VGNSTTDLKSQSKHRCVKNIACAGCWWLMKRKKQVLHDTGHQWLMPEILAIQEDVRSQPQANGSQDPISKKPITKKGWWSGSRCRP